MFLGCCRRCSILSQIVERYRGIGTDILSRECVLHILTAFLNDVLKIQLKKEKREKEK